MKKLMLFLALVLLVIINIDVFSQKKIKFDVKTRVEEKSKTLVAKAGLIGCLNGSNWAFVGEIGEKFTIWLKKFEPKYKGNLYIYSIDVEIREPSMIDEKKLIYKIQIKDTINLTPDSALINAEQRNYYEIIAKQLNKTNSIKNIGVNFVTTSAVASSGVTGVGLLFVGTAINNLKKEMSGKTNQNDIIIGLSIGLKIKFELEKYFNIKD